MKEITFLVTLAFVFAERGLHGGKKKKIKREFIWGKERM